MTVVGNAHSFAVLMRVGRRRRRRAQRQFHASPAAVHHRYWEIERTRRSTRSTKPRTLWLWSQVELLRFHPLKASNWTPDESESSDKNKDS